MLKILNILTIAIFSFFTTNITIAQIFADFEENATTPPLSPTGTSVVTNPDKSGINPSDSCAYYEKPSGNWLYIAMSFPEKVYVGDNNNLKFKIYNGTSGRVYVKFWKGAEVLIESWAHDWNNLPDAGKWVELQKDMTSVKGEWFDKLEVAAGVDNSNSGDFYFDDFELEKIVKPTALFHAVESANALLASMNMGNGLGEFPTGTNTIIEQALANAQIALNNQDELSETEISYATSNLLDTLVLAETFVMTHENRLIDTLSSYQTVNLFRNLEFIANKRHQLFGMHDATAYGIDSGGTSWQDDGTASKSDIKQVTGSHGAISSYDAEEIVGKSYFELDLYRKRLIANFKEGGVNTICWHMRDPKFNKFYWSEINAAGAYNVVQSINQEGDYHEWYKLQLETLGRFFKGLRGENGEAIPIIFRPFHEHNGSWFWWGASNCSTEEYVDLWKFTVGYLRDTLNVHNLIYAFSPDASHLSTKGSYFNIFPGDTLIDIFGMDSYFGGTIAEKDNLIEQLTFLIQNAEEYGKLPALTETGSETVTPSDWYTNSLLAAVQANNNTNNIAYYATWRNASTSHHYVPYPGHPAERNFLKFYDDSTTLFLNDLLPLYDTLLVENIKHPADGSRINEFTFDMAEGTLYADTNITVAMPIGSSFDNLTALFALSDGATATVSGVTQESGVVKNDFTNPVIYKIKAQNQFDSSLYKIEVVHSEVQLINVSPHLIFMEIGDSVQFYASGINQLGIEISPEVQWSVSGDGIIDDQGWFKPFDGGTHSIIAAYNDISGTGQAIVTANTNVNTKETLFKAFPNPAENFITIYGEFQIHKIEIYNLTGQLEYAEKNLFVNNYTVDINNIPSGLYLLQISSKKGKFTHKIYIK